jgi:Bacterial aa3 type cytochrome c oxidase subunit IV
MADHSEVAYTTADGNDYEAHEQTYEGFIMLVKYGTGAVIVILALMALFLTGPVIRAPPRAGGVRENLHAFRPQNRYPSLPK